jgi:hypothetical protein
MPQEIKGTRISVDDGDKDPFVSLTKPGDYIGPIMGYSQQPGVPSVWFLLPISRDQNVPAEARALHHCESPPHVFTEEPDGSLTIRNSIGAGPSSGYYWHGYLTKGYWRLDDKVDF